MATALEDMQNAVGAYICAGLGTIGPGLLWSGANLMRTGAGVKPGVLAIGAGALSMYLQQTNCTWPSAGNPQNQPPIPGCWEAENGYIRIWQIRPSDPTPEGKPISVNMGRFLGFELPFDWQMNDNGKESFAYATYNFLYEDGSPSSSTMVIRGTTTFEPFPMYMKGDTYDDSEFVCKEDQPSPPEVIMPPQTINYGDCVYNIEHLGWMIDPDSDLLYSAHAVTPGGSAGVRAGGGVMGGCNFEPTLIIAGGDGTGGPGVPLPPIPPGGGGDEPWWLPLAKQAAATAAGSLAAKAIEELLTLPYEGVEYLMPAPCDKDEDGNPLIWTGEVPTQKFESAVLDRLDALSGQISQHLAWKTPICSPEPPALEGEFRTISFRSDEVSPFGNSRLRKRLRYRSSSGNDLDALIDHWKDFVWQAGPVVVGHVGGPWGSPQVWAASESEAKLVLHHAAAEAGFDPDQVGEWKVGVSSGTRLGVSGTMRVDTTGGYYWITARDGSDNRPIVAYPSDL